MSDYLVYVFKADDDMKALQEITAALRDVRSVSLVRVLMRDAAEAAVDAIPSHVALNLDDENWCVSADHSSSQLLQHNVSREHGA